MAKVKYYYDTESCSFEKAKVDGSTIVRTVLSYLFVSGMVAGMVAVYMFYFAKNPMTDQLRQDNRDLSAQMEKFDESIKGLEADLESLHKKDEEVYRTILKADPIKDEWEAGSGGSAEFKPFEKESLQETDDRMEALNSKVRVQKESFRRLLAMYPNKEEEMKRMPSIRPVGNDLISGFGYRLHPILKVKKMHTGLDFRAPVGTAIYATADGVVTMSGHGANGYGIQVDVSHGFGYETKYAHLSKVAVQVGQKVKRGDLLAYSGDTGLSKGPHLHYEIKKDGVKIGPVDYFYSDLSPEQYVSFKKQANQYNESMD
jgi:murein DD-endopeptidase MepM/ murein hydrolase activator NlpD